MDVRLGSLALSVWITCALTLFVPFPFLLPWCVTWACTVCVLWRTHILPVRDSTWALVVIGLMAGLFISLVRVWPLHTGQVSALAQKYRVACISATVVTDPIIKEKSNAMDWSQSESVHLTVTVSHVAVREHVWAERVPVLLFGEGDAIVESVKNLIPGTHIRFIGVLSEPGLGSSVAALVKALKPVHIVQSPPRYHVWAQFMRHRLHAALTGASQDVRGLVPGLALGDSSAMPSDLSVAMRAAGLSHLIAVSGANVTVLMSVCIALMRRLIRRKSAIYGASLLVLVAFVILVRPQPSVLRAAVMGVVALLAGFTSHRRNAMGALCCAVVVLLISNPWLALSWGFALSVAATAGLVLWSARILSLCDRVVPQWCPLWIVDTLVVTLSAQVAVFPLMVALGSTLSLASIPANLLAVPLSGLAMLDGLVTAIVACVCFPAVALVSWPATWSACGIARVARYFSGVTWMQIPWPRGCFGVVLAIVSLCAGIHLVATWKKLEKSQQSSITVILITCTYLLWHPPSTPHRLWPVSGWLMVQCDVGQGDGAVIRTGQHTAVVIDAGPDPTVMDRCLSTLGITSIPLIILTHFHADHVGGLAGVVSHRRIGQVLVSPLAEPILTQGWVMSMLREKHVQSRVVTADAHFTVGQVSFQCLWPRSIIRGQGSDPNNASLVFLIRSHSRNILLTADIETAAQNRLQHDYVFPRIDAVKVAHHGSRNQSFDLAQAVHAPIALVSVGADNDYGHPAPQTIALYRQFGAQLWRTDQHGDLALVPTPTGLSVRSSR